MSPDPLFHQIGCTAKQGANADGLRMGKRIIDLYRLKEDTMPKDAKDEIILLLTKRRIWQRSATEKRSVAYSPLHRNAFLYGIAIWRKINYPVYFCYLAMYGDNWVAQKLRAALEELVGGPVSKEGDYPGDIDPERLAALSAREKAQRKEFAKLRAQKLAEAAAKSKQKKKSGQDTQTQNTAQSGAASETQASNGEANANNVAGQEATYAPETVERSGNGEAGGAEPQAGNVQDKDTEMQVTP